MMKNAQSWFIGLTRREQVLVGIAGIMAGLVLLVYGIILPAGAALHDAADRHAAAVERSGRLLSRLEQLKAPAARSVAGGIVAGPLDQQVAASAEAAGLVLQSNQSRGTDTTIIAMPTARASAVLIWLDNLAAQGVALESLTITPAADGSVAVNATLRKAGS